VQEENRRIVGWRAEEDVTPKKVSNQILVLKALKQLFERIGKSVGSKIPGL